MANDIKRVDTGDILYRGDAGLVKSTKRQSAAPASSVRKLAPALNPLAHHCSGPETRAGASMASTPRAHLLSARNVSLGKRPLPPDTNSVETELQDFTVPLGRIINKHRSGGTLYRIAVECEKLLLQATASRREPGGERTNTSPARARHADKLAMLFEECSGAQDGSSEARQLLHIIEQMYGNRTDATVPPPACRAKSSEH